MRLVKTLIATALSLPLLLLAGCKSIPSYSADYAQSRNSIQGIALDQAKAQDIGLRFTSAFNTLGTPEFVENAGALYADQLFINDTLSQFSSRQNLLEHFQGMNKRVSKVSVKLLNASYHQDSAYVHWHMAYDFKLFGTTRSMDSYGISEIKINENNKIIFQQDFWDPANGLYRSLPYVGGVYSWLLPFKK
ncbi:nuclear transport factor 2 family protein [Acinetobacter towneri]|uniref:nuclear transport factor 2 family protein n=1 Tax=Acinetobacter towneri TaxID=202956 RepID=UPI001F480C55|nr:nuclear transport factor 2 family protein [Acinetobacter towneri]UIP24128.1 nuclear transport factor 2 family protein [Acinetobacter towneri]